MDIVRRIYTLINFTHLVKVMIPMMPSFDAGEDKQEEEKQEKEEISFTTKTFMIISWRSFKVCAMFLLGTLNNHKGNANEYVTSKIYKFALLEQLRNYSYSFNLYNVAEQSRNRIGIGERRWRQRIKHLPSCTHVVHSTLSVRCLKPATHYVILFADCGEFDRQQKSQAIFASHWCGHTWRFFFSPIAAMWHFNLVSGLHRVAFWKVLW